jgi:hypothetical protein
MTNKLIIEEMYSKKSTGDLIRWLMPVIPTATQEVEIRRITV